MAVFKSLLLDSCHLTSKITVFILFDGFLIHWEPVEVLQMWQKAHDQVDLVFRLKVDVEASEVGQGCNALNRLLKVLEGDILQVEIGYRFKRGEVFGQALKLVVRQVKFFQEFELAQHVHDDVQVFDLLILQVQKRGVRLVLEVLLNHVFQVLLRDGLLHLFLFSIYNTIQNFGR